MGAVRAARRAAYEVRIAEAVRRVSSVEQVFTAFSDMFPGTDGTLAERAMRGMERMDDDALVTAISNLSTLRAVADRAQRALLLVQKPEHAESEIDWIGTDRDTWRHRRERYAIVRRASGRESFDLQHRGKHVRTFRSLAQAMAAGDALIGET